MLTGCVDRELINRAARLNACYLCKPVGADDLLPVVSRALIAERASDPRVAACVDALLRDTGLETLRSAELLRLSVGGKSPDDVAATMKIGEDGYAYHVGKLLSATGARSIEALVNQILRSALGES